MKAQPKRKQSPQVRVVSRGDGLRVHRKGLKRVYVSDLYAELQAAPWFLLLLLIVVLYLLTNVVFASIYLYLGNPIENAAPDSFSDAFFFSVQTMATIGYGKMVPIGMAANILVTVEALFGFAFFAIVTGLVFSKFSRPTARVLFSRAAVIGPYDGKPHLMMRLANERSNRIVDADIEIVLARDEVNAEGTKMRRFHDLKVSRHHVPLMQYTWLVMHPINKESPLDGLTAEELKKTHAEVIVALKGYDEALAQPIYTRYSYIADEIIFNAVFEDILNRGEQTLEIDYAKFHATRSHPHVEI